MARKVRILKEMGFLGSGVSGIGISFLIDNEIRKEELSTKEYLRQSLDAATEQSPCTSHVCASQKTFSF